MHPHPEPELAEKVAFLRRPESFPDGPASVEAIETHFAWVFISKRYAYKLMKPMKFGALDLSAAEARRLSCELEVDLNRRLAERVYIGVVPLGRHGSTLRLEADADPVDWLVKMHRLRREDALDRLLPRIDLADRRLGQLLEKLCDFYRRTVRTPWSAAEYRRFLARRLETYRRQLAAPELGLERREVSSLVATQATFLARHASLFSERIERGRVVDAHGDLRPEHVFLGELPQVIDCLGFAAELRLLDTAEELSFLALECDRLGRPELGDRLLDLYVRECRDDVPERLLHYYRSQRALVRALLSAWHLREHPPEGLRQHWLDQAHWYLEAAAASIQSASR